MLVIVLHEALQHYFTLNDAKLHEAKLCYMKLSYAT